MKEYTCFLPANDTEAQNYSKFRNDYIVGFRGVCCSLNALVIEFCKFGSVESLFGKGKLTEWLKLLICCDCARGMAYLHSSEVFHRDLKPDNLLVVSLSTELDTVRAKLSDFGTAKESINAKGAATQEGTPIFMAPEVSSTEKLIVRPFFPVCFSSTQNSFFVQ